VRAAVARSIQLGCGDDGDWMKMDWYARDHKGSAALKVRWDGDGKDKREEKEYARRGLCISALREHLSCTLSYQVSASFCVVSGP